MARPKLLATAFLIFQIFVAAAHHAIVKGMVCKQQELTPIDVGSLLLIH